MINSTNIPTSLDTIRLDCKVYIVLLNYNGAADTIECLESLQKLNYSNFQVLIIDNSPTNLPFETLLNWAALEKVEFDQTTASELDLNIFQNQFVFIKVKQNNGFAAGNNIALNAILKVSGDHYVWLLNNDTVVDKESLKNQISYLLQPENNRIGILGSKLIYYFNQDKIQAIGGKFNKTFYISTHIGEGEPVNKSKEKFPEIDYVVGASMLVSHHFLRDVGTLSEDFFLYYEELDWANRAKKNNWNLDWCGDSIIFHKEGASIGSSYDSKQKSFFSEIQIFKSRKIFVKKYYSLNLRFYISSLLLVLNRVRKGKFKLGLELLNITFGK